MAPITPLALVATFLWAASIAPCAALSIPPRRAIGRGYRRSISCPLRSSAPTAPFGAGVSPSPPPSNDEDASLDRDARILRNISRRVVSIDLSSGGRCKADATTPHHHHHHYVLHSIALVATGRRLAFLVLSMTMVNFVRSAIFKIPKSEKKMFDECPWPFTLFHDPMKFAKDGATHVVAAWALMCLMYSRFEKARAIMP